MQARWGVLSGDEFKSMRETAPVEFLDALAKAAGIARDDLKGFAAQQKLTTDIVLRALDDLAGTADAKFGAMALSGEEAFNVLTTGLVACAGRVDESLGATSALNSAMQFLGEYMAGAGDGARIMANAIKIAGAVALVTAGNRGVGALSRAFRDAAAARRLDVAAARDAHRASRQAVIDARSELAARSRIRRERHLAHQQRVFNDLSATRSAKRYRAATRAGGDAAQEAARKDVAAINDRIRANEKLRHELAIQARAELNDAKAAQEKLLDRAAERARQDQINKFKDQNYIEPFPTTQAQVDRNKDLQRQLDDILDQSREQLLAYARAQKIVGENRIKAGEQTRDLTTLQQLMAGDGAWSMAPIGRDAWRLDVEMELLP